MNSNLEAYVTLIGRMTAFVEQNKWVVILLFLLPLAPAVAFRSVITMFIVMTILAVAILAFPIYQEFALWLWVIALTVSTVGGAFHIKYQQAERHQRDIIRELRRISNTTSQGDS